MSDKAQADRISRLHARDDTALARHCISARVGRPIDAFHGNESLSHDNHLARQRLSGASRRASILFEHCILSTGSQPDAKIQPRPSLVSEKVLQ